MSARITRINKTKSNVMSKAGKEASNKRRKKDKEQPPINTCKIYRIMTKELSIWSNINVEFEFKDKDSATDFIEEINKLNDVNIEFIHIGYVTVKDSAVLKHWIDKSTKDCVTVMEAWAKSFTREHSKGFERQFHVKKKERRKR